MWPKAQSCATVATRHFIKYTFSPAEVQLQHQMGKKEDLSAFEHGMVVGARQTENFGNCWPTWILMYNHFWGSENGPKRRKISTERQLCGQNVLLMWEVRGEWAGWRCWATLTQITPGYHQGRQNSICECTTHGSLKKIGYSCRRPLQDATLA